MPAQGGQVSGGKLLDHSAQATHLVNHVWQGKQYAQGDDNTVKNIDRDDGYHPGQDCENDNCRSGNVHSGGGRDGAVGNDAENPAATPELVGGDGDVGQDYGQGTQQACGGVIAFLQEIGHGVFGDAPHPAGDKISHRQSHPGAEGEPQHGQARPVSQSGATEE